MKRSYFKVMTQLLSLIHTMWGYLILAILLGLIGHLCASLISVLAAKGVLLVLNHELVIGWLVLVLVMLAIARALLRYGEQSCNHYVAFKVLALIRHIVFKQLRRLSPAKLQGKESGELISLVTSDIELLEVFYAHTISPVLIAILMSGLFAGWIGWHYHWSLAVLLVLAHSMIGLVVPVVIAYKNKQDGQDFRDESSKLSHFVLESLQGYPELIQYHATSLRQNQLANKTDQLLAKEYKMKSRQGYNMALTNSLIWIFNFLMVTLSLHLAVVGKVSFEGAFLSSVMLMSSYGPFVSLANLGSMLQNTVASGNRVLDLLEEQPEVDEVVDGQTVSFEKATVDSIRFAYEDEMILKDISCQLEKNMMTAVVGPSGVGKSTLLKLLMRFWDVSQGRILISEIPLEHIKTTSLRNIESYMTQETMIFNDTIANNVALGNPQATLSEIESACQKAAIHDFITQLPNGYQTRAGELGSLLSTGEKQRLGLARVFLHNAPFLLLDEPTSNVDSLNEAMILQSLSQHKQDKTIVIVSHKPRVIQEADKVIEIRSERAS